VAGELSALALVDAHLDRITRLNPTLNAFVDVAAEAARAEAQPSGRSRRARRNARSARRPSSNGEERDWCRRIAV
jgi:Asp-tRNA(Asn)/Glu-tRNA(Gln) amidotransferase A subunit family amidase